MKTLLKHKFLLAYLTVGTSVIVSAETVNVATTHWCPFICVDDTKRPGLLVEFADAALKKAGYEANFKPYPWSRGIWNVTSGFSDALLAPAKNEAPGLVFPNVEIGAQRFCFFALKENTWIYDKPVSVVGKRVIYLQDALPEVLAEYKGKADFSARPYTTDFLDQTSSMLIAGRTEAVLMTYYSMRDYINVNDLADSIHSVGCLPEQKVYLAFTPDSKSKDKVTNMVIKLDKALRALYAENYFETLLVKYNLQ
jgi:polar amino acid transport system substrate-binding protein